MRKTLMIAAAAVTTAAVAFGAAGPASTPAQAGEAKHAARCATAAGAPWIGTDAVRRNLEELGYRVSRVKVEHGCYEARAMNDTGIPIELLYHPASGDLVRARLRS